MKKIFSLLMILFFLSGCAYVFDTIIGEDEIETEIKRTVVCPVCGTVINIKKEAR